MLAGPVTTGVYFVIALVFPLARRRLRFATTGTAALRVRYPDGRGILRRVIHEATGRGFTIGDLATVTLLPEPKGASLEQLAEGGAVAARPAAWPPVSRGRH